MENALEIRARIYGSRARLKLYVVAARVGLHPTRLSAVLNGHTPLSPELAERLRAVISEIEAETDAAAVKTQSARPERIGPGREPEPP